MAHRRLQNVLATGFHADGDRMKTRLFYVFFACVVFPLACLAQISRVFPWNPSNPDDGNLTYHPEPVLFVHGINDNDEGWEHYANSAGIPCTSWSFTNDGVLPQLNIMFLQYFISQSASDLISGDQSNGLYRATQRNYLHTFNYGDHPGSSTHDRQAYDPIAWNAWSDARNNLAYTNTYLSPPTNQLAGDTRATLDERIDGIRTAYHPSNTSTNNPPQVIMIAHSLGGLLSHYYMLKRPTEHGVRRLVTLATPHQGTHYADWLVSFNHNPTATLISLDDPLVLVQEAALTGAMACGRTAGYFLNGKRGAINDAVVVGPSMIGSGVANFQNPLMDFFWNTPAPKIEYVFNVYHRGAATGYQFLRVGTADAAPSEAVDGDGFVAPWSAAGKTSHYLPSIWNGGTNVNANIHEIDPVIFGIWEDFDHSAAEHDTNSILRSLCGVPYRWPTDTRPPNYHSFIPDWAHRYDENQSFSKYLPVTDGGSVAYTDEPGVSDLKLLFRRADNYLFVPAFNTWGNLNGLPAKIATNIADFVGHQVIGLSPGGSLKIQTTLGTKNHSQTPAQTSGTNYWIVDGNEYLPASLKVKIELGTAPILDSNFGSFSFNVYNCLINLDASDNPQFQYGLCNPFSWLDITVVTQNFVAVQARNVAGFVTPQAERAFDVPVDSATVVDILKKINQGEVLSNGCHGATNQTPWKATVSEWVNSDTGTITLNFFSVSSTPIARDAWTNIAFIVNSSNYNTINKTITVNPTNAPSQLIVSNEVYLGCNEVFTNSYGGIVPALTANTLAGVPINEVFLTQIRTALAGILHKYQTNTACVACGEYDLPTALHVAGISNDTWSAVVGHLILPSHITELQKVLGVLTDELHCCCSNVTITLSPSSVGATGTNALPDGSSNVVYSTTITAGGTDCPHYKFTVASGSSLPPDLILTNLTDTSAAIIGTPTTVGSNTFVITVTETNGCSTNQTYSIAINSWSGTALCDCPCWPPNTCPSGNLAQTYIVTAWHQLYKFDPLNWNECKLTAPTVVTASTDWYDHCHWQAGSISELPTAPIACRSTTDGGVTWSDWSTGLTYLDAGIPGCGWIVAMTGTAPYGATKQTGLTPIGSYSRSDVFAEATATVTVSPP